MQVEVFGPEQRSTECAARVNVGSVAPSAAGGAYRAQVEIPRVAAVLTGRFVAELDRFFNEGPLARFRGSLQADKAVADGRAVTFDTEWGAEKFVELSVALQAGECALPAASSSMEMAVVALRRLTLRTAIEVETGATPYPFSRTTASLESVDVRSRAKDGAESKAFFAVGRTDVVVDDHPARAAVAAQMDIKGGIASATGSFSAAQYWLVNAVLGGNLSEPPQLMGSSCDAAFEALHRFHAPPREEEAPSAQRLSVELALSAAKLDLLEDGGACRVSCRSAVVRVWSVHWQLCCRRACWLSPSVCRASGPPGRTCSTCCCAWSRSPCGTAADRSARRSARSLFPSADVSAAQGADASRGFRQLLVVPKLPTGAAGLALRARLSASGQQQPTELELELISVRVLPGPALRDIVSILTDTGTPPSLPARRSACLKVRCVADAQRRGLRVGSVHPDSLVRPSKHPRGFAPLLKAPAGCPRRSGSRAQAPRQCQGPVHRDAAGCVQVSLSFALLTSSRTLRHRCGRSERSAAMVLSFDAAVDCLFFR